MKVDVRGEGRPLVYLHPAGGIRWTRVLDELSRSFTLHVPTFPGFDGTPTVPSLDTRRGLALRVAEYIEKSIKGPADVLGCSFGGAVALWLSVERPQLVDHLVLECPAGLQTIDPALRADPDLFFKALYAHPEKITFEKKPEQIEASNRGMMAHYGAVDGKDPELLERIPAVQPVTLILHGTEDRIVGKESMQLLKGKLPKSFLVYIWDAGHNIEVDQPERMLAVVRDFLGHSDAFMVNRAAAR
jgi:pimeloyl-ACP methyl ester carboxylesterase